MLLFESTDFDHFKNSVEKVMARFEELNATDAIKLSGERGDRKKKVERQNDSHRMNKLNSTKEYFFPKFLTSKNLFDLEVQNFFKVIHHY